MKKKILFFTFSLGILMFGFLNKAADDKTTGLVSKHLQSIDSDKVDWSKKDKKYWKSVLTPIQYSVTREESTERAFTGQFWDFKEKGVYTCSNCGLPLFHSETKFKSGTGWPSYYQPIKSENVAERKDSSFGMSRTEVHCSRCKAHLGHVFPDGPKPTGLRYCINSVSLNFKKDK